MSVFYRQCKACGHLVEGGRGYLKKLAAACPQCGKFALAEVLEREPTPSAAGQDGLSDAEKAGRPAKEDEFCYCLQSSDGIFNLVLPRPAAIFGRAQAVGKDKLGTVLTVSRNQFYYSYGEDGSLAIVNQSSKGTLVNRMQLDVGEQVQVSPPASIAFGGLEFSLVVEEAVGGECL